MTREEILAGESKAIEYKEALPDKSSKYMKTVVAFANGKGGKLVFGIKDITCEVVGISNDMVFKTMDAITNAISDSCEPTIIPDISLQEIDGKTIIVVEIFPGRQRPYFVKSMGIQRGTFIRSAGTTRPAESYMIQELILEGTNNSFDQLLAEGQTVTEEEIEKLCSEIYDYAKMRCRSAAESDSIRNITKNQLLSWGLLCEKDGNIFPTNGFCLLAGKTLPSVQAEIQCAVFKGKNRAIFIDRRTYRGPIQQQIEDAYNFVLRNIRMGAKVDGLYRQDIYEFPIEAIREVICNAVCHRSYLEPAAVQVALYDDRLEVTSPGMLLGGVSIKKMKEGYSKIRNRGIASAFVYMKIIESWGSGIPRMIQECKNYELEEPELMDYDGDFRVNLYRKELLTDGNPLELTTSAGNVSESAGTVQKNAGNTSKSAGTVPENAGNASESAGTVPEHSGKISSNAGKQLSKLYAKEQHRIIMDHIKINGYITSSQTETLLHIKQRRARDILSRMTREGLLERRGSGKNTVYYPAS